MVSTNKQSLILRRQPANTLLAALLTLSLVTTVILMQYHYQAAQAKLMHELSDRFIAQTLMNLSEHQSANFNQGTVTKRNHEVAVKLKDGATLDFK